MNLRRFLTFLFCAIASTAAVLGAGESAVYINPSTGAITRPVTAATFRNANGLQIGVNVQAYDADLTTWAGLTPSANAQSLVTAVDYSAMRTLLGLVIGTNVQAYDADLTTWAGITPSANVQTLLGSANYAAFRSSLSAAKSGANSDITGLTPGGDFVITQNGVANVTFKETNATVDGLFIEAGTTQVGTHLGGGLGRLVVKGAAGQPALRLDVYDAEFLINAGGNGTISIDASGIVGGRWGMQQNGEITYGVTNPTSGVRLTVQGLSSSANDIQRWTAYTGTGTAGATVAKIGGAGQLTIGGGGTAIASVLSAVKSGFDCPSIAANGGVQTTTLTVTGATTSSIAKVSIPSGGLDDGVVLDAYVSAADTVTIKFTNATAGAIDPGSKDYRVLVINF